MLTAFAIALSFLKRIPWQAWAGIAAALALWWLYSAGFDNGLAKGRAELAAYQEDVTAAQAEAERLALAAKAEQEARYRELAERTDENAAIAQQAALSAADAFIRNNRVRCPAVGGVPSGTIASAGGDSAGRADRSDSPAELAGELVAVPASDVRICTINTARLIAAQEWANGLAGD